LKSYAIVVDERPPFRETVQQFGELDDLSASPARHEGRGRAGAVARAGREEPDLAVAVIVL
jgi:hypothetical protein